MCAPRLARSASLAGRVTIAGPRIRETRQLVGGLTLRARALEKEGHVRQAAIVDNKVLGAALQYARELQQQRDDKKLKSRSLTKRDKRLLRARRDAAEAPA